MNFRTLFKTIYNKLTNYLNVVKGLLLIMLFSSLKTSRRINNISTHKKKCMVLANGPSLQNDIDFILSKRISCNIMVLNFFCNSEYFKKLKPDYYCIADPVVFNSPEGALKLKSKLDFFIKVFNQIKWECKLFYPSHFDTTIVLDKINNPFVEKIKYNSTPLTGKSKFIFYLYSKSLLMPVPESVIIASIFITINMSFKKIYLFGADHSWITDFKVYEDNTSSFTLNHFDSKDIKTNNDRSVSEFMVSQYRLFKSHEVLDEYSNFRNTKIINKTLNSFIDSYEKK